MIKPKNITRVQTLREWEEELHEKKQTTGLAIAVQLSLVVN
jgi:hypothetical protein